MDALGNAVRFTLTGGNRHDCQQAESLTADFDFDVLIADKGYDSEKFLQTISERGAQIVVPSRANRLEPREIDKYLYRERHLIECFINKLKQWRRIFSRFEKLSKNYLSFIHLVSSLIWLR